MKYKCAYNNSNNIQKLCKLFIIERSSSMTNMSAEKDHTLGFVLFSICQYKALN